MWLGLGFVSFGGPAGQIAIMHREVVERRGWLDERRFTDALNFCMLLLGLSYVYAQFGGFPAVAGVLLGLKAAVIAIAVVAFVGLEFLNVSFPLLVLVAGAMGAASAWHRPRAATSPRAPQASVSSAARVATIGMVLWLVPLAWVVAALGAGSLWTRLCLFFTQAAFVTFGGAYAVLGYVTTHLVHDLGWVTVQQSVAGLALAETTPGPLVIVLQIMGFMAGWNLPAPFGPAGAAVLAAMLASWATFLPSFVFIFLGAPHVERIAREPRMSAALAAITAAVVGVIATLALLLGKVVLWPGGIGGALSWSALAIAAGAWLLLQRTRLGLVWVLAAAALAGLGVQLAAPG